MIKLELPNDCQNYETIVDTCLESINITRQDVKDRNLLYKDKIEQNKSDLIRISKSYIKLAQVNFLFKYQYCKLDGGELIRMGNHQITNLLTNKEMIELYDDYFSKKDKPAREFYEKIINNAKNPNIQCPFCGGVGEPNELDHFLPKSGFGYYSIFPYNLIPICENCNQKRKKTFYPTKRNEQLIHPYLDNNCFFDEQWLFAEIILDSHDIILSTAKFYVRPTDIWSDDTKGKINFHFEKFELDRIFSTKSAVELGDIIDEIITSKNNNRKIQDFITERLDTIISSKRHHVNSWKKLYINPLKRKFIVFGILFK
ncbi:hypothetical protein MHD_01060 [Mannheimia granulomatis]|uniref:Endonuclease n=1 Tax=Mannheimia granulomatis TaxID=85402 RepID=A0A011NBR1_9PAST|nr:hypothetical protein [Mannheimia granulomatis]EXI62012.1 endonuclease [Mannheimia granulomatis]RGE49208.1 hypothetical protein MHD_01060 [Mannheimia granulomatis]